MSIRRDSVKVELVVYEETIEELKKMLEVSEWFMPQIQRLVRVFEHNLECDGQCEYTVGCSVKQ